MSLLLKELLLLSLSGKKRCLTPQVSRLIYFSKTCFINWFIPVEQPQAILELFSSLQLLLHSCRWLEVVVATRGEGKTPVDDIGDCSSVSCCRILTKTVAHQTALYCSKVLQVSILQYIPVYSNYMYIFSIFLYIF